MLQLAEREYDAIVIGAGASGGIAALLLADAGLDVLVLDAGWSASFWRAPTRKMASAAFQLSAQALRADVLPLPARWAGRAVSRVLGRIRQPVQSTCFAWVDGPEQYVDDRDAPYETPPDAPFHWIRAWQVGGRMAVPSHGRLYSRMAPEEFGLHGRNGGWPIGFNDLAPWYDIVEGLLGLSQAGAPQVPPAAQGRELQDRLRHRWPALVTSVGRTAPPLPALASASLTGRVTFRDGAVAHQVLTDATGATSGAAWFDRSDARIRTARARLVFLAASALESARILMMSRAAQHPDGLGGQSGALGRYLMDHLLVSGTGTADADAMQSVGPEPHAWMIIRRMDRRDPTRHDEIAPYSMQLYQSAQSQRRAPFAAVSFAPMAPRWENRISLHPDRHDAFRRPLLRITCRPSGDELATASRQARAIVELAEVCNARVHRFDGCPPVPGAAVHEAGVARMGLSPDGSVLNPFNECWDAPGLFVTDAAAYPSLPSHAPTLTGMALTARAVQHALRARGHAGLRSSLVARTAATLAG